MKIDVNKIITTASVSLVSLLYTNHLWLFNGTKAEIAAKISGKMFYTVKDIYNPLLDRTLSFLFYWDKFMLCLILSLIFGILVTLYLHNRLKYVKFTQKDNFTDKIFVLIFLFLLLLPAIYLNPNTHSNHESRNFAKFKALYNFEQKRINKEFGKDLSDYFNDRFFGRIYLVYLNREIILRLSTHYAKYGSRLIDKHQGKMFNYWNVPMYSLNTAEHINQEIKKYNDYCNKNNSKLFVLVIPNQNSLYDIDVVKRKNNKIVPLYIRALTKNNNVRLIFPINEFVANNKPENERLYFYTDHHTTDSGTFIAYQELMKAIRKEFSDVETLTENDFTYFYNNKVRAERFRAFSIGQTCKLIGLSVPTCEKYLDYNYKYFKHKNHSQLSKNVIEEKSLMADMYHYNKGANHRVMIFGDSSVENLMEFIPFTFKDVYKIRLNGPPSLSEEEQYKLIKNYDKELKKFKPDIVIVTYGYTATTNLQKIAEEN